MTAEDHHALEKRCKEVGHLLDRSIEAGFRMSIDGGRLEIQGPADADPQLRERLLGLMTPIMPLFLMRVRLLALAHQMDVPRELVMRIPVEHLRTLVDDHVACHPHGQRCLALYLLKLPELAAAGDVNLTTPPTDADN